MIPVQEQIAKEFLHFTRIKTFQYLPITPGTKLAEK